MKHSPLDLFYMTNRDSLALAASLCLVSVAVVPQWLYKAHSYRLSRGKEAGLDQDQS